MNDTPQQKELDKVTNWQFVELHAIECTCTRCTEQRELEKIRREAKQ